MRYLRRKLKLKLKLKLKSSSTSSKEDEEDDEHYEMFAIVEEQYIDTSVVGLDEQDECSTLVDSAQTAQLSCMIVVPMLEEEEDVEITMIRSSPPPNGLSIDPPPPVQNDNNYDDGLLVPSKPTTAQNTTTQTIHNDNINNKANTTAIRDRAASSLPAASEEEEEETEIEETTRGICHNFSYYSATGPPPICLYLFGDEDVLTPYECLIRKQLEFFELSHENDNKGCGNGTAVVGIQCRLCVHMAGRSPDSTRVPNTYEELVRAAQQLAEKHLLQSCQCVSPTLEAELKRLMRLVPKQREQPKLLSFSTHYWAEAAKECGVCCWQSSRLTWSSSTFSRRRQRRQLPKEYYNWSLSTHL